MSDLPILTPSECATLKEAWARIEVSNYRQQFGRLPFDLRSDAVTVIDAAPSMLATIAELRIDVDMWEGVNRSKNLFCEHFAAYTFTADGGKTMFCTLCRIAAHEATIAELKRKLEERK